MSDLTMSMSLTLNKVPLSPNNSMTVASQTDSMALSKYSRQPQSISNSARTAILLGDVVTPGWAELRNNDSLRLLTIYPDATNPATVGIPPGKSILVYFVTATPYAQFDADSPPVSPPVSSREMEYFIANR